MLRLLMDFWEVRRLREECGRLEYYDPNKPRLTGVPA